MFMDYKTINKTAILSKLLYRFITFPIIPTVLKMDNILKFIWNVKDLEESE